MLSEPTGQATTEVLCTASHFPQGVLETQRALFTLENLPTEEAQVGFEHWLALHVPSPSLHSSGDTWQPWLGSEYWTGL